MRIIDYKLPRTGLIVGGTERSYFVRWHGEERASWIRKTVMQERYKSGFRYEIRGVNEKKNL